MANQTTERYEANKHCEFDCFDLTLEDIYQYGCEFEFYINKSLDFKSTIIEIKDKTKQIIPIDIFIVLFLSSLV